VATAGVCGWLFVYTGDLPDIEHLSQFAPSAQSPVFDSCLASPSTAIPFNHIGKPLQDALAAAESPTSLPHQIAQSLMCNHTGGMGRYHANNLRLSWHIRRRFSAQQVFTIYANRAYFGSGATGVENASIQFFRKHANALNVEEAALLAGFLRAPNYFSPYKNPERALQRRNQILEAMVAQGNLSTSEGARAEATPVVIATQ
jgi:membrane carboxypeptidase/penicillin-binding protein